MGYKKDDAFSKIFEGLLAEALERRGAKVERAPDKRWLAWDILVNDEMGIEVKADKHDNSLIDNPNCIIEWSCNGRASGIQATESKWYFYFYTRRNLDKNLWGKICKRNIEVYKLKVDLLKEYINQPQIRIRLEKFDNSDGAWGYLLPINDLVKSNIATKIKVI